MEQDGDKLHHFNDSNIIQAEEGAEHPDLVKPQGLAVCHTVVHWWTAHVISSRDFER